MIKAKLILAILLAAGILTVAFQNRANVETHLLFATIAMPHFILLLMTAAVGFVLGALVAWVLLRGGEKKKAP